MDAIVQVVPVKGNAPPSWSVLEKLVFCFANSVNSGKQLTFLIPPFSVSKKYFQMILNKYK